MLLFSLFFFLTPPLFCQIELQSQISKERHQEERLSPAEQAVLKARIAKERILAAQTANFIPAIDPTGCTNGDFELGDFSDGTWHGSYGRVEANTGILLESDFVHQLLPGTISSDDAHHTIVTRASDPEISDLMTTSSSSSTLGLRLGNTASGYGAEMISKTFFVKAERPIIKFDYAVVLENPTSHKDEELPTFLVRVRKNDGTEINNVVDLDGNGANYLKPNNSSFFNEVYISGNSDPVVYSQWLCASINLNNYVGELVTVDFITKDCAKSAHFAYAYLDNVCSGCENAPTSVAIDQVTSSECGAGKFCVDYALPEQGSVALNLRITKPDGTVILEKNSPELTDDSAPYCFTLTEYENELVRAAGDHVNVLVTGNFREGRIPLPSQFDAISQYPTRCSPFCCNYTNLIAYGDFEQLLLVPSGFQQTTSTAFNAIRPGMYGIVTGAQADAISNSWFDVNDEATCASNSGRFMAVNGQTGGCGIAKSRGAEIPEQRLVWEGQYQLETEENYIFCFDAKKFHQLGFDIEPRLIIKYGNTNLPDDEFIVEELSGACNWRSFRKEIFAGQQNGSIHLKIYLDQCPNGDGNDFALDNLALMQAPQCPKEAARFDVETHNDDGTNYSITVNAYVDAGPCQATWWAIEQIDATTGQTIPGTRLAGVHWDASHSFNGYDGTDTRNGNDSGTLDYNKLYKISRGTWAECQTWNSQDVIIGKGNPYSTLLVVPTQVFQRDRAAFKKRLNSSSTNK